jgi:hypothetical protein
MKGMEIMFNDNFNSLLDEAEVSGEDFLKKLKSAIYVLDLTIEAVTKIAKGFSGDTDSYHYINAMSLLEGFREGKVQAESVAVMMDLAETFDGDEEKVIDQLKKLAEQLNKSKEESAASDYSQPALDLSLKVGGNGEAC